MHLLFGRGPLSFEAMIKKKVFYSVLKSFSNRRGRVMNTGEMGKCTVIFYFKWIVTAQIAFRSLNDFLTGVADCVKDQQASAGRPLNFLSKVALGNFTLLKVK